MKFVEILVGKMRDEILMSNFYNENSFWWYSRSLPLMWSENCKYSSIDIIWHLIKNAAFQVIPDLLNTILHFSEILE